ncbi:MAG: DUF2157 domain-containing protein [Halobacteriota archaeon]|nr:DUF2157 domain-containing protein [Halobacteriota archaeon]
MDKEENIAWLSEDVKNFETKGIINEDQAQKILSRYGPSKTSKEPIKVAEEEANSSRSISAISISGAILVGAGAILFIASNWEKIPRFIRLILLFGTTFGTYFTGWRLEYDTKSRPILGHALIFLASILVGVTILLTAQIFHINANEEWLILLWFLTIVPFVYAFDSKPILGLSIFTFVLWMGLNDFFDLIIGYRVEFVTFLFYLLFGICLYSLGILHNRIERYSRFGVTYEGVGLFFILISYYSIILHLPNRVIFGDIDGMDWVNRFLFVLFGITALISIMVTFLRLDKLKRVKNEFYILSIAIFGWIIIWLFNIFEDALTITTTSTYPELSPGASVLIFSVFNLIFFVSSIGSILIGYHKKIGSFFSLGAVFFALGVLNLYFTEYYELLPRSLTFIIGGAILLGGGWYFENKRRSPIKNMEVQKDG